MDKRLDFLFSIPRPPPGPLVELSAAEMEKLLLQRRDEEQADPTDALWQLARFYSKVRQHEKALDCLRQVMARLPDLEGKAHCVLAMGQTMEQVGDFPAAARYYREALALEPSQTATWYFIQNNLGFSLNQLGQFTEGERYCRKAIEIDPSRPNAHKNLGIALAGQGQYREAAECFVAATQANAADARAFHLLQDLLREHPELGYEFEDAAAACQRAVEVAGRQAKALEPTVARGWKKRLILVQMRLRSLGRRLRNYFR